MSKKGAKIMKVKRVVLSKSKKDELLLENFVNLQKALTHMAIRMDTLSSNISRVLELFETTAKSFTKKQEEASTADVVRKLDSLTDQISRLLMLFETTAQSFVKKQETGEEKDLVKKLDILLDQNKTIAKGLTLVEEKIRHRLYGESESPMHHRMERAGERPAPRMLPKL